MPDTSRGSSFLFGVVPGLSLVCPSKVEEASSLCSSHSRQTREPALDFTDEPFISYPFLAARGYSGSPVSVSEKRLDEAPTGFPFSLCWVAQAAISVLEARCSLRRILETWFSMVRSERKSSFAIWRLDMPW